MAYWVVGLINTWLRLPGSMRARPHMAPQNQEQRVMMTAILCVAALFWPVAGPQR